MEKKKKKLLEPPVTINQEGKTRDSGPRKEIILKIVTDDVTHR